MFWIPLAGTGATARKGSIKRKNQVKVGSVEDTTRHTSSAGMI